MPGTLSQADLVADLKASLNDAADVFSAANDADFKRHLEVAALAMGSKRPRPMTGTITVIADQSEYAAPADFDCFGSSLWGISPSSRGQPWERSWPGRLPQVAQVENPAGTFWLSLQPAPSAHQINVLGAAFRFVYFAKHSIHTSAALTSIAPADRGLLLLRAQAEAMRELAIRGSKKPAQLRDGYSGVPRNATPGYLYQQLLDEFTQAA
jgi:hypothetical protein